MLTFKPDSSLSFADFLRLMYAVHNIGEDRTFQLVQVNVDEAALKALPEEFHKYFRATP